MRKATADTLKNIVLGIPWVRSLGNGQIAHMGDVVPLHGQRDDAGSHMFLSHLVPQSHD